jgi:microcystin-dependent protein
MSVQRVLESNSFFFYLLRKKEGGIDTRLDNKQQLNRMVLPVPGDYKWSAKTYDFNGWMICDGRSLYRTDFPHLYSVLKYEFGGNDEYFNLPDCRGRTPCAIGEGVGLTPRVLGQYDGYETITLTVDQMPTHNHTITDPGHAHFYINQVNNQNTDNAFGTETAADETEHNQVTGNSTTGITINNTGLSAPHDNMQPSVFLGNVFIYSGAIPFEVLVLDDIREWLLDPDTNVIYTDAFTDTFTYSYDAIRNVIDNVSAGVMFRIRDGGSDMFDSPGGNFIWFGGDTLPLNDIPSVKVYFYNGEEESDEVPAVPYGTLYENPERNAGFFVSGPGIYPHLTMTYAVNGTTIIKAFGEVGTDGGGQVNNFNGTYVCDNGRSGQYWACINFGADEDDLKPTVGDVWFTVEHSDWNTNINNIDDGRKESDTDEYSHYVGVTGTNYILCKVLISRPQGVEITPALVTSFLSHYVQSMPATMGFHVPYYD